MIASISRLAASPSLSPVVPLLPLLLVLLLLLLLLLLSEFRLLLRVGSSMVRRGEGGKEVHDNALLSYCCCCYCCCCCCCCCPFSIA